ncbi:MAG TPA: carotenoid oxygenase family protein [Anaerolineales bacterium]|nr:carotenoid oxygenase family protein [Anaerolineales bacterium]
MRYVLGLGRILYRFWVDLRTRFIARPLSSTIIPDAYCVCNIDTVDSEFSLSCLSGEVPADIKGSLYIAQCLGSPGAFMVGDTNLVKLDFDAGRIKLTNRLMRTPAALARKELADTRHRFDFFGLMYLSPGLGMFSYTEGMYLLPDGRIAVTSDIDRPWVIERETLQVTTPIGRRDEWIPMMEGSTGEILGSLFAGYNNSHVVYADHQIGEVFLVNYQKMQPNGEHPVFLIRWDGKSEFERWLVLGEDGKPIEIKQSIHELVYSRDYVLLADTAFVAGTEMFTPWVSAPLPSSKTVVYIVDRRELDPDSRTVTARRMEVDEACIHLVAEYENPDDKITAYMLHTPATNTAELIRENDRDLNGNYFPEHLIGYGTLPVLDLSSVGKHVFDMKQKKVIHSQYLSQMPYTWGPYLYAYMGRQTLPYNGQDLFVMFKGFSKDMLPKRICNAYKDTESRRVPLEEMVDGEGLKHNNSICRIITKDFKIADAYIFPDRVLLYTIACLDSKEPNTSGYVIAGIVTDETAGDESSGHEYWLFAADDLAGGPICKLSHPHLNNSTLFHSVYIPDSKERENKSQPYHISLRDDYSIDELEKWREEVLSAFRDVIWPYFDMDEK